MNKRNLFALGLGLVLFATACKKQDLEAAQPAPETVTAPAEWKTAGNWSTSQEERYTAQSTSMQDDAITSAVVENGLVLVYMKDGNSVESLPYRQKGATEAFWYYQISEKTIQLNADVYSANQATGEKAFNYFVISPEKLKSLEEQGHTQASLMALSYEAASTLLK